MTELDTIHTESDSVFHSLIFRSTPQLNNRESPAKHNPETFPLCACGIRSVCILCDRLCIMIPTFKIHIAKVSERDHESLCMHVHTSIPTATSNIRQRARLPHDDLHSVHMPLQAAYKRLREYPVHLRSVQGPRALAGPGERVHIWVEVPGCGCWIARSCGEMLGRGMLQNVYFLLRCVSCRIAGVEIVLTTIPLD